MPDGRGEVPFCLERPGGREGRLGELPYHRPGRAHLGDDGSGLYTESQSGWRQAEPDMIAQMALALAEAGGPRHRGAGRCVRIGQWPGGGEDHRPRDRPGPPPTGNTAHRLRTGAVDGGTITAAEGANHERGTDQRDRGAGGKGRRAGEALRQPGRSGGPGPGFLGFELLRPTGGGTSYSGIHPMGIRGGSGSLAFQLRRERARPARGGGTGRTGSDLARFDVDHEWAPSQIGWITDSP